MTINSNNFEEFFLLYVDNEIDPVLRAEVEDFVEQHPGLKGKLNLLIQTKLSPEEEIVFENKDQLYKQPNSGLVTLENYENFFLLYTDNELPEEQRAIVEEFVEANPGKKQELKLLQHTKLQADDSIKFPGKQSLYRLEKKPARIVPIAWMRSAAAAAVIIAGGLIWMNIENKSELTIETHRQVATSNPEMVLQQNISPAVIVPPGEKNSEAEKKLAEVNTQYASHADRINRKKNTGVAEIKLVQTPVTNSEIDTRIILQDHPVANISEPEQSQINLQSLQEPILALQEEVKNIPDNLHSPVKPVILDAAAFTGNRDKRVNENFEDQSNLYLSINNNDIKTKGKLRGLFRKVSRLIDRATNAEPEDEKSFVRIASFEIAKK